MSRAVFDKEGKDLFTSSVDGTARVWKVENASCRQVLTGHNSVVLVVYSANNDRLLTMSKDNTCRIWQLEPEVTTLQQCAVMALAQHPTAAREAMEGGGMPLHVGAQLRHWYRKWFPTNTAQSQSQSQRPGAQDDDTPLFESGDGQ